MKSNIKYPRSACKKTQNAVETAAKKTERKTLDRPYKAFLALPENGKDLLFRNRYYQLSVLIGKDLSAMHPVLCVLDNDAGPSPIRAYVLDPIYLDSIRQRDMLDNRYAFHTRLKVTGTIALHFSTCKSGSSVSFGAENKPVVPAL